MVIFDQDNEQIILREYQKADHKALENVVREAWKYDRFCSSKTAAKMAKVCRKN